jgi:AraC-like DNA-binding protein
MTISQMLPSKLGSDYFMSMWQTIRASEFRRHVHRHAYAAVVLSGSYEEAGDLGRLRVRAGDVILHEAFEAHLDRFPASGATVLNITLPANQIFQPGLGSVGDPDSIVRIAEKSEADAAMLLLSSTGTRDPEQHDWPDELASAILRNPSLNLSHWSQVHGIASWSLSRGFTQVFAVSPSAFRARARTRRAWKIIRATNAPLASIAAHCGFADQSHMTRSVKSMTGKPPRVWHMAANRFKTH